MAQEAVGKIQNEAVAANGMLDAFIATSDASSAQEAAVLATKVSRMEEILETW